MTESANPPRSAHGIAGRIGRLFRAATHAGSDLVLPPLCRSCGTRLEKHDALCANCWRQINFIRAPLCDRLGIPLPFDTGGTMISAAAAADPPDFARARAVAIHDGVMRELVHAFKFADSHESRRLFGRWLIVAGTELISDADIIVPMPLSRWRLFQRRYNQAQLLATEIGRLSSKPVAPLALVRAKHTRPQVGLSASERKRNVRGAFKVPLPAGPLIAGRAVLLVDDVITTGATASAAARALKRAGASRVDVLALTLVPEGGHQYP